MIEYSQIPEVIRKMSYSIGEKYNTIFSHSGNVGDSREKLLINFLTKIFPTKYGFSSGEVFDKDGLNSGQIDIIIYDYLYSLVYSDGTDGKILSPIESTYGIIEVKSTLTTKTLKDSLDKINMYSNLFRPEVPDNTYIINPDLRLMAGSNINFSSNFKNIGFNCIFSYENNVSKETIHNMISQNKNIDLLIVPNKLVFFGRQRQDFGLANNEEKLEYFYIENENALGVGILYIQTVLSNIHLIGIQKDKVFLDFIRTFDIGIFK